MVKLSTFASIYLLASIMYCNLLGGNSYLFFTKITRFVFSGLSFHISLSACIISDDRRGALCRVKLSLR